MRVIRLSPIKKADNINSTATATLIYIAVIDTSLTPRGDTVEQAPRIRKMFATFEPITLPNAIDGLPLNIEARLEASSGSDVPTATNDIAITASETPHARAIFVAESTNRSPP
jgi:hypothetical protein